MQDDQLLTQIRSLEVQLAVLKARYQSQALKAQKAFADLYGSLQDKAQSTEEEIDAVLFRFRWEDERQ